MKRKSHIQCKKERWHFWKLINFSNRQDKFSLQMTIALVVLTAAKTTPLGFGCYYFTMTVTEEASPTILLLKAESLFALVS